MPKSAELAAEGGEALYRYMGRCAKGRQTGGGRVSGAYGGGLSMQIAGAARCAPESPPVQRAARGDGV